MNIQVLCLIWFCVAACPDEKVKITISTMKSIHKCITTNIELTDTLVNDKLYVQGVKDLIGLFKANRKSNDVDDFYVGITDTAVDEQGDIDQYNAAHKEIILCVDREDNCNIRDITHNVLTDEKTSEEETDDSHDAECDSDDDAIANLFTENVLDCVEQDTSIKNCILQEPVDDPKRVEVSDTNMDKDAKEESLRACKREPELINTDMECNLMFVDKIIDEIGGSKLKVKLNGFTTYKGLDNLTAKQDEIFDDSFCILRVYCRGYQ